MKTGICETLSPSEKSPCGTSVARVRDSFRQISVDADGHQLCRQGAAPALVRLQIDCNVRLRVTPESRRSALRSRLAPHRAQIKGLG